MALLLTKSPQTIEVITFIDDSLDQVSRETYDEYLKDLDESRLTLISGKEPTRFVFKKHLSYSHAQAIKNQQVKMSKDGNFDIQMAFTMEDVRLSLVDIKNPSYLADDQKINFKADGAGGLAKDVMENLISLGVIDDFYRAISNARDKSKGNVELKK